ncbi:DAO-domain-containing protein [Hypoxylon sp. FL0890]|nr:DAO-domain-containing protein [Hypoxylon sp. FL0890]
MRFIKSRVGNFLLASKALRDMQEQLKALTKRANARPGFPQTPTNWAEVVIIGSGITAAAVARSILLENGRHNVWRRVIVLESRGLCSGATGRSGGQVQSSPHELFDDLQKSVGPARAARMIRFQISQIQELRRLCAAEKWDIAGFREIETVDFYLTEEERDAAFKKVEEVKKHVPELGIRIWGAEDARKFSGANKTVKGAVSYPAANMSPYNFVSCVWKSLLSRYPFFLYIKTHTTVVSIQAQVLRQHAYEVITTNETFECNHVVHATNAFATELVPGLRGKLTGMLGTMTALRPSILFPYLDGGRRSWVVSYGHGHDIATQRSLKYGGSGDMILGDPIHLAHLRGILPTLFESFRGQEPDGWRTMRSWSGIMGITGDLLPFVGRLDDNLTGRSVMIAGTENDAVAAYPGRPAGPLRHWFPYGLAPTPGRLRKADLADLVHRSF